MRSIQEDIFLCSAAESAMICPRGFRTEGDADVMTFPTIRATAHRAIILTFALLSTIFPLVADAADDFTIKKLSEGIFAAIAKPGGKAQSNVLILVGKSRVMIAGAHFSAETISEITSKTSQITPFPIRSVVLTHHHRGFPFLDFDFPRALDILTSSQTRDNLRHERRTLANNVYSFDTRLTIDFDGMSIILTNIGVAHSTGDIVLFLPEHGILFTSDLIFNDTIGFMGDGSFRAWIERLDELEELGASTVVPGLGQPGGSILISGFRTFFREFLTEIIRLKEKGKTLSQAVQEFSLPAPYRSFPGYANFMQFNIEKGFTDPEIR